MALWTGADDGGGEQGYPDLGPDDRFKIEYDTVTTYILHYSNVRSALASFLITVALGSFGSYYSTRGSGDLKPFLWVEKGPHILWVAGYLFLAAAVAASLYFTYMTERTIEYSTRLWNWGINRKHPYPGGFRGPWTDVDGRPLPAGKRRRIIAKRVAKDTMNALLIVGSIGLGVAFYLFES
jgi:hypothetical protein